MLEQFGYLVMLAGALGGLAGADYRWKLALFYDKWRAVKTVILGTIVFLIWDLLGISLGIFFIGDSSYMTGLHLAPELPLEELFFLILLTYNALLLWRGSERLWPHI